MNVTKTQLADPQLLDSSVDEVFRLMLGVECRPAVYFPAVTSPSGSTITAVVGFGGSLSGACTFHATEEAAVYVAGLLAGMQLETMDDTVRDAIGEVCNMLAGTWKGRLPELASTCALSVPAVVTGNSYDLRVANPEFRVNRTYAIGDRHFDVAIACERIG